jgi:hypothetical protein
MPALQDSDLGNFSFIQKPYRMSEIMKTLRRRDTD